MIRLDAASVFLQWSTGGLLFLWVTTRRRLLGVGYGWLMRLIFAVMALGALAIGLSFRPWWPRDLGSAACAGAALVALVVSYQRRRAGVAGHKALHDQRSARVAAMTGIDRPGATEAAALTAKTTKTTKTTTTATAAAGVAVAAGDRTDAGADSDEVAAVATARGGVLGVAGGTGELAGVGGPGIVREFPPGLDLLAPGLGALGLVGASFDAGGPVWLAMIRLLVGAAFLGAVTDAMLLGHWYLVQPGLPRAPLKELVIYTAATWPLELVAMLLPTGMISVLSGSIDDGYGGLLGWFWATCAVATPILVGVTWAALKERQYSAVMAATGLLYLAIITAFGMDLVGRATLR
ncbi:MAG: hypothetical protein ACKV2O_13065 [Acidimicrobiales bacterium]